MQLNNNNNNNKNNQSSEFTLTRKDIVPTNHISKYWYDFASIMLRTIQRNKGRKVVLDDSTILTILYNGVLHLNSLDKATQLGIVKRLSNCHDVVTCTTVKHVILILHRIDRDVMCLSVNGDCDNCPLSTDSPSKGYDVCRWLAAVVQRILQTLPPLQQDTVITMTQQLINKLFLSYNLNVK